MIDIPLEQAQIREPADRPPLSISIFGNLAVSFRGRRVEIKQRKPQALLAFLALSDNSKENSERLCGLLSSKSDEIRARASLRQCVRELCDVFEDCGFDGLQREKLTVSIDHRRIIIDLWEVLKEA